MKPHFPHNPEIDALLKRSQHEKHASSTIGESTELNAGRGTFFLEWHSSPPVSIPLQPPLCHIPQYLALQHRMRRATRWVSLKPLVCLGSPIIPTLFRCWMLMVRRKGAWSHQHRGTRVYHLPLDKVTRLAHDSTLDEVGLSEKERFGG